VETAIGITLLLLLTFSVVDAGLLFFAYLTLQNGVTEATRFAITGQQATDPSNPSNKLPRDETVRRMIRASTPGMTIKDDDVDFAVIPKDPTAPTTPGIGGPNDVIRVTVQHQWQLLSPMLWPFVGNGGQFMLRVSATMKNEPYKS